VNALGLQLCDRLFARAVEVSKDDGRRVRAGEGQYTTKVRSEVSHKQGEGSFTSKAERKRIESEVVLVSQQFPRR